MNKKIFLLLIILTTFCGFTQKRIAVYNVSTYSSKANIVYNLASFAEREVLASVPAFCVDFFSKNKELIIIDRKNLSLIDSEREIQKSENFMDGYVVGQGKSEGVDMICQSVFDIDTYTLNIKILDVKEEKVLCTNEKKLDKNFWGLKDLKQQVSAMLVELSSNCFETEILVLRATEIKGKKAKTVLISAGTDLRVKIGYKFEIYETIEETLGKKVVKRKNTIGFGEVLKVEDENFSILELIEGREEILNSLNSKTQLNCRPLIK